ncbi:integrin alpha-5-like [Sinocyclocheilus rhinocerous]|uniref:integrin alpha-5-like n=1 Tax=Sinocyclocheilus rhinocerous TaxID=307959 RepID=UPI0007B9E259|nr:PREDICTED: integrin alpha-5-like [Sinocyclocheilus rhinocerous]
MEQRLKVSLLFFTLILSILIYSNHISGFNLDLNNYTVFSGPEDSYFGFSVDFYQSSSKRCDDILIGAPLFMEQLSTQRRSLVKWDKSIFTCKERTSPSHPDPTRS